MRFEGSGPRPVLHVPGRHSRRGLRLAPPRVQRLQPRDVRWLVVATFSSVLRQHVLQTLAEYDERGGAEFLRLYGFAPDADYTLVHEGVTYDARAVLGVAHRLATGRLAPADEFHGMDAAVALLRKRGFEVHEPFTAVRAAPRPAPRAPRAPRASTPRATSTRTAPSRAAAAQDEAPAICPTCFMVLPATGFCDNCA